MSEKTKHTATPWQADNIYIWGANKEMVADLPDDIDEDTYLFRMRGVGGGMSIEEQEANANFMIKAVNNHEGLVEALEEVLNSGYLEGLTVGQEELKLKTRKALDEAEGTTK